MVIPCVIVLEEKSPRAGLAFHGTGPHVFAFEEAAGRKSLSARILAVGIVTSPVAFRLDQTFPAPIAARHRMACLKAVPLTLYQQRWNSNCHFPSGIRGSRVQHRENPCICERSAAPGFL